MPFTRRPDSFLVLSGPGPEPAKRSSKTATGNDSLSAFGSEAQPAATDAPQTDAPVIPAAAPRYAAARSDATMSARRRQPVGRPQTVTAIAAAMFIVISV